MASDEKGKEKEVPTDAAEADSPSTSGPRNRNDPPHSLDDVTSTHESQFLSVHGSEEDTPLEPRVQTQALHLNPNPDGGLESLLPRTESSRPFATAAQAMEQEHRETEPTPAGTIAGAPATTRSLQARRNTPLPEIPVEERDPATSATGQHTNTRSLSTPTMTNLDAAHDDRLQRRRSELDWIVPVMPRREREPRPRSISERLNPTLESAKQERDKYAFKAKMSGYAINAAIGMQVVLGALTTGLSAVTSGRQTSIMTSVLGGLSTIFASYLARARGSNEPELSITRRKDLEQYVRECEIFLMDFGHVTSGEHDARLDSMRARFEELLGNGNGERRLDSA